ncbi:hypothetical protein J7J84_04885 [bacterium]|nr:hypothetical protein [bacterium]
MRRLLAPDGCPWDREQTLASLRQYVTEEAAEVVAAIDRLLEVEALIRAHRGLPPAEPSPPEDFSTGHAEKGRTHAHHPARETFDQAASGSGAPLGEGELPEELAAQWEDARRELTAELGDLMLQPVFQGVLGEELGYFSLEDVIDSICEKLIRRHPHVFGGVDAPSAEDVLDNWEAIKREEKKGG